MSNVIAVFTYRKADEIICDGGSQAWALNPQNARRCRYLVCTRNRYTYPNDTGPEEHGAAFLVGKVIAVDTAPDRADRYIVRFNEYALLDPQPVVWPGARNPVWYLDNLADLKIEEDALVWHSILDRDEAESPPANAPDLNDGLLGDVIHKAIARTFGAKPASVTITITL